MPGTQTCIIMLAGHQRDEYYMIAGLTRSRSLRTHAAILAAARELFARYGYAGTSTRALAARSSSAATPAGGRLRGILDVTDEELVSSDFNGNPHSSIVDLPSTALIDGSLVKVLAWYDNEWGYSCRVRDLIRFMSKSL